MEPILEKKIDLGLSFFLIKYYHILFKKCCFIVEQYFYKKKSKFYNIYFLRLINFLQIYFTSDFGINLISFFIISLFKYKFT